MATATDPTTPSLTNPTTSTTPDPTAPASTGLANTVTPPQPFPGPSPVAPIQTYNPVIAPAQQATATGYNPTPYVVPEKGLVQNQIKDIVGNDSPLMQQARVRAMQTMNERGLANSSLNTEAGQKAVLDTALPIAQADAASNVAAMTNTANAQNVASQFGAGAENAARLANSQLVTTLNFNNATAQNTQLSAAAQAENVRMLSVIDNNTKQALALLDTQNRQLLQTNANAASMFQETVKNIAGISVDATLSQAAKDAAVATQINLLNQGLQTTAGVAATVPAQISSLNLDQYFQPTSTGSYTPAQKAVQLQNLNSQLKDAQRNLADAQSGRTVPVLTGPNASERRAPIWNQAISDASAAVSKIQDQIDALNAPPTP